MMTHSVLAQDIIQVSKLPSGLEVGLDEQPTSSKDNGEDSEEEDSETTMMIKSQIHFGLSRLRFKEGLIMSTATLYNSHIQGEIVDQKWNFGSIVVYNLVDGSIFIRTNFNPYFKKSRSS
jgi:hypothetical protein